MEIDGGYRGHLPAYRYRSYSEVCAVDDIGGTYGLDDEAIACRQRPRRLAGEQC